MASKNSSMDDMVKAVSSNPAYKVLTKEEYNILMSKHAGGSPKQADPKVLTSTPDAKKVQFEGAGSKLLSFINKGQAPSPHSFYVNLANCEIRKVENRIL